MEKQSLGIANLMALATVIAASANVAGAVLHDNKVDLKDLPQVPAAISVVGQLSDIDFDQVEPEIKDLTGEEQDALAAHFKKVFDLENDDREQVIEQGFDYLLQGYEAFKSLSALAKKFGPKAA